MIYWLSRQKMPVPDMLSAKLRRLGGRIRTTPHGNAWDFRTSRTSRQYSALRKIQTQYGGRITIHRRHFTKHGRS